MTAAAQRRFRSARDGHAEHNEKQTTRFKILTKISYFYANNLSSSLLHFLSFVLFLYCKDTFGCYLLAKTAFLMTS